MGTTTALIIRPLAADDDALKIGELVQSAYFQLPGYPRDVEYDRLLADVRGRAVDSIVLVAILDDQPVGCLTYIASHDSPHAEFDDPMAASFRYFAVAPTAQGSGVGGAMVSWCIDRARTDGKSCLRIHTLESMPGAQRLYGRLGFRRDPESDEDWDGIKGIAFVFDI